MLFDLMECKCLVAFNFTNTHCYCRENELTEKRSRKMIKIAGTVNQYLAIIKFYSTHSTASLCLL